MAAITTHTGGLAPVDIDSSLLDGVAEAAGAIDRGEKEARSFFPALGSAGLLDLGVGPDGRGSLLDQAAVIETLAQRSLSLAFAVWGQRMSIEYLASTGGDFADRHLPQLRQGTLAGVSGMAPAFKAHAGAGELGLELTRDGQGHAALAGRLHWASNLYPGAIVVSAADRRESGAEAGAGGRAIVAFSVTSEGVEIGRELDLLALRGTASTSVTVDAADFPEEQILSEDFDGLLAGWRPIAAVLQSSFCFGLAAAGHEHARSGLGGINAVFTEEVDREGENIIAAKERLVDIISRIGTADRPEPREVLRLRLEAGRLATAVTALEIRTAGGKGYVLGSDANRRFREATFVPVQSPSESQLRWELDRQV